MKTIEKTQKELKRAINKKERLVNTIKILLEGSVKFANNFTIKDLHNIIFFTADANKMLEYKKEIEHLNEKIAMLDYFLNDSINE